MLLVSVVSHAARGHAASSNAVNYSLEASQVWLLLEAVIIHDARGHAGSSHAVT